MIVRAATLLSYALVAREVISMTISLPSAVRMQLRSSITQSVLCSPSLSSPSCHTRHMHPAWVEGKHGTLIGTTLLIGDARESTGGSLYWAEGMGTTRLHGSGSDSLGTYNT